MKSFYIEFLKIQLIKIKIVSLFEREYNMNHVENTEKNKTSYC